MNSILYLLTFCLLSTSTQKPVASVIDYKGCTSDVECKTETSSCCDTYEAEIGGEAIDGGKICHQRTGTGSVKIPLGDQINKFIQKCAGRADAGSLGDGEECLKSVQCQNQTSACCEARSAVTDGSKGRKAIKVCSPAFAANKTIPYFSAGNYVFPERCAGRRVPQVTDSVFASPLQPCTSNFHCSAVVDQGACCAQVQVASTGAGSAALAPFVPEKDVGRIRRAYESLGLPIREREHTHLCISKKWIKANTKSNEFRDPLGSGLKWRINCEGSIKCRQGSDAECKPNPKSPYPQQCCAEFKVSAHLNTTPVSAGEQDYIDQLRASGLPT